MIFFQKGLVHGFGPKLAIFLPFFIGNRGQKNVFYILERKNAFLGDKNQKFKKSESWHFPKGVSSWFLNQNCPLFQLFSVLGNKDQENVFNDILERKNTFLGYKNKKLKKSDDILLLDRSGKCIYDIWERRNASRCYKTRS